ncbi:MAG: hypothetical protein ACT4OE_07280 [Sphingosinicella sp.]
MRSWPKFVGEVGIIVVGVLIALASEQFVESLHYRRIAAETRVAITDELNTNLASLALRQTAEPCIDRRLNELRRLLGDWEAEGRFETPQWVAQAPSVEVDLTRYHAAVSAGRLALLSSEEQFRIGSVADGLRRFEEIQEAEVSPWGRLRALQAGPRDLSTSDRTMLRAALQDASTLDYRAKLSIRQLLPEARLYGFNPDFARFRELAGSIWRSGRYTPSICTPIDTPRDRANETQIVPLPL